MLTFQYTMHEIFIGDAPFRFNILHILQETYTKCFIMHSRMSQKYLVCASILTSCYLSIDSLYFQLDFVLTSFIQTMHHRSKLLITWSQINLCIISSFSSIPLSIDKVTQSQKLKEIKKMQGQLIINYGKIFKNVHRKIHYIINNKFLVQWFSIDLIQ